MSRDPRTVPEKNRMIRRFERSEIILHWANAVPFLILLVTGALNILSRFVVFSPAFLMAIRTAHKITGVLWIASIGFSFFFVGRALNMANLRDQLCMGFSDIAWMIRAFRSAYNPHVKMPPAGKFNTGQKINAVLVILYAAAFAGSGALMWAYRSMLLPWFVHVSVFLLAVASLGGHLYLSLLHPSTRPGLIGIFTGMVPRSYVQHHHSLMVKGTLHAPRGAMRTASGVIMKSEIVLLLLTLTLGGFGIEAIEQLPNPDVKRGFEAIVAPGELSKAHSIKEIDGCAKCHEYSGELPDGKCLSCHKTIQARREARSGYHGGQTDKCIRCHKEHPGAGGAIVNFDKEKFDHTAAAFPLEGKHRDLKCDSCHKRKISEDGNDPAGYYVGLRHETCLDCHKDVHAGGFGEKKCGTCHSATGWKDLKFDHSVARFPLEGKHAAVACGKCHAPRTPKAALAGAVFTGVKFGSCSDCHKDPHRKRLRAGCASCHSAQGWRGHYLKFDHNRGAAFRLEGKHRSVPCARCHRSKGKNGPLDVGSFTIRHASCANCHRDPHRGEVKAACSSCHSVLGWRGEDLKFDHNRRARFKLEGKHRSVACGKCHRSRSKNGPLDVGSFTIRHASCANCHKDPHRGEIKAACSSCHSVLGWKGENLKFDHDRNTRFRLKGKHESLACVKCHRAKAKNGSLDVSSFRTRHASCANCHKDPHRGEFKKSCAVCHSAYGWRGNLMFDHGRDTSFRLEGKHRSIACVKCHRSTASKALNAASFRISNHEMCAPCHKHKHKGKFVVTCDKCHGFVSWKVNTRL